MIFSSLQPGMLVTYIILGSWFPSLSSFVAPAWLENSKTTRGRLFLGLYLPILRSRRLLDSKFLCESLLVLRTFR